MRRLVGCLAVVLAGACGMACQQEQQVRGALPPTDVRSPPPDATFTDSGLAFRILAGGYGGRHPAAHSRVEIKRPRASDSLNPCTFL
ncbi:MAG: hypothetical protein H0T05_02165 [Acidobacteria bacterium]|nr:hypothetical protein [Acidobacteriota bacterium]MBA3887115.1 hypothetical protein [Acidobacteriota bacterium]